QAARARRSARKAGPEHHGEGQAPGGQHRPPVGQAAEGGSARACSTLLVAVGSAVVARHEQPSMPATWTLAVPVAGENAPVFDHASVCAYFAERMARRASQTPFPPPFSTASPAWVSAARYASGARLP